MSSSNHPPHDAFRTPGDSGNSNDVILPVDALDAQLHDEQFTGYTLMLSAQGMMINDAAAAPVSLAALEALLTPPAADGQMDLYGRPWVYLMLDRDVEKGLLSDVLVLLKRLGVGYRQVG